MRHFPYFSSTFLCALASSSSRVTCDIWAKLPKLQEAAEGGSRLEVGSEIWADDSRYSKMLPRKRGWTVSWFPLSFPWLCDQALDLWVVVKSLPVADSVGLLVTRCSGRPWWPVCLMAPAAAHASFGGWKQLMCPRWCAFVALVALWRRFNQEPAVLYCFMCSSDGHFCHNQRRACSVLY